MFRLACAALIITFQAMVLAQVVDVNGDGIVGAQEALALAEEWKQEAKDANEHNHLDQTWGGTGDPLKIQGSFTEWLIIHSKDEQGDKTVFPYRSPSAPLVLENTNASGYGLKVISDGAGLHVTSTGPDLILVGSNGIIAATSENYENLTLLSNNNIYIYLDKNRDEPHTSGLYIMGRQGYSILELSEDGDMWLRGTLTQAQLKSKIDHPLDPANKNLTHAALTSPEQKTVYDGVVVLDASGEAWVDLPEYCEALNTGFRYQLTPIGAAMPRLHIAEKVRNNRFKIAGGAGGIEVSWQVTGVRQDDYAKDYPVQVEEEKTDKDKGHFLHPELFE